MRCCTIHTEQVSSKAFENCGKYRHPHLAILLAMLLAILRVMLNMFNFLAILLEVFSYLEEEIDYNLAKKAKKC